MTDADQSDAVLSAPQRTCSRCGLTKSLSDFYESQPVGSYCKPCQREYVLARRERRLAEDAVGVRLEEVKQSAIQRNLAFNLDRADMERLVGSPNCECCGRLLDQDGDPLSTREFDRVDNNRGYEKDNCFPTCYKCNRMKRDLTVPDARAILRYMESKLLDRE